MTRFENGGKAFLLADVAGVGKTREILAVADQMKKLQPDKKVLIVSLRGALDDSFARDAKAMNIDLSSFEVCTYDDLLLKVFKDRIERIAPRRWSFSNLASIVRQHLGTYVDLMAFLKSP